MGELAEMFVVQALAAAVQFVVTRLLEWLFPQAIEATEAGP